MKNTPPTAAVVLSLSSWWIDDVFNPHAAAHRHHWRTLLMGGGGVACSWRMDRGESTPQSSSNTQCHKYPSCPHCRPDHTQKKMPCLGRVKKICSKEDGKDDNMLHHWSEVTLHRSFHRHKSSGSSLMQWITLFMFMRAISILFRFVLTSFIPPSSTVDLGQ